MDKEAAKELCEKLIHADAESEVIDLLKAAGCWDDPNCWRYYGDSELNWSQAGGQQGRADFALNEKAINSIDAVLTLKCLLAGIDPEGPDAPGSIREAVAKFFEHAAKLSTAHFSDRGHSFQADRGQRFSVIADGREVHEWLRASYLSCPASA